KNFVSRKGSLAITKVKKGKKGGYICKETVGNQCLYRVEKRACMQLQKC
ncbi:hypothetical protein NC652_027542, partial [Populus alba x Populus x berolinensis]